MIGRSLTVLKKKGNMEKYKINIHAHTFFSDGSNSPLKMAEKAKELGFTALVITDHYYGGHHPEIEITFDKLRSYNSALREARKILPVIRGMEVAFGGEEFLLFGSSAIKWILSTNGLNTKEDLIKMKEDHYCAIVLCHPMQKHEDFVELLDGYEAHNSGQDWFGKGRELGCLEGLQAWHNSDAHNAESLGEGYNIVNKKIENEDQLIKYIKSGVQPEYFVSDR